MPFEEVPNPLTPTLRSHLIELQNLQPDFDKYVTMELSRFLVERLRGYINCTKIDLLSWPPSIQVVPLPFFIDWDANSFTLPTILQANPSILSSIEPENVDCNSSVFDAYFVESMLLRNCHSVAAVHRAEGQEASILETIDCLEGVNGMPKRSTNGKTKGQKPSPNGEAWVVPIYESNHGDLVPVKNENTRVANLRRSIRRECSHEVDDGAVFLYVSIGPVELDISRKVAAFLPRCGFMFFDASGDPVIAGNWTVEQRTEFWDTVDSTLLAAAARAFKVTTTIHAQSNALDQVKVRAAFKDIANHQELAMCDQGIEVKCRIESASTSSNNAAKLRDDSCDQDSTQSEQSVNERSPHQEMNPNPRYELKILGEVVAIRFDGEHRIFKKSKGFRQLAYLLAHRGRRFTPIELDNIGNDKKSLALKRSVYSERRSSGDESTSTRNVPGHDDEIVDQKALQEYQARIAELDREIEQSRSNHDDAKAESLERERTSIIEQIKKAIGMNGKPRRREADRQKGQRNVRRCLDRAFQKLNSQMPKLHAHLKSTILKKSEFSYSSEIEWFVSFS